MRVLVTGSRAWRGGDRIRAELGRLADAAYTANDSLVVVHGACPQGADQIASLWVKNAHATVSPHVSEEPHPADWDRLGKRAGFVRNAEMVASDIDVCLAFIRARSKGATHCARLALEAGIESHVWTTP